VKAIKLTPEQSWNAILSFTKDLSEKNPSFSKLFNHLKDSSGAFEDWKNNYLTVRGRTLSPEQLLTQEEVFTTLIELCSLYIYKFGNDFRDILRLLYLIRYVPEHHEEQRLWEQTIQNSTSAKNTDSNGINICQK